MQTTDVSRYGLYGTVGSKRELFEQALEQYAEVWASSPSCACWSQVPRWTTFAQFSRKGRRQAPRRGKQGLSFIHTANEPAPQDEELRGVLQRFMKRMSKAFAIGLDSAKGRDEVAKDVDVDAAGELLTSSMFGLAVLGRTGFPKTTLDSIVDSTLDSLRRGAKY